MDRELGRIERFVVPQVFPRRCSLVPRLKWHSGISLCSLLLTSATSESETFLSRQHAVDPPLFAGLRRIQRRKSLGQTPEALVAPHPFLDEKPFQSLAAPGRKQNHALVYAVENGLAVALDYRLARNGFLSVNFFKHLEQIELWNFLFLLRCRDIAFVLAKQVAGAFPYWQQPGLFARDLNE